MPQTKSPLQTLQVAALEEGWNYREQARLGWWPNFIDAQQCQSTWDELNQLVTLEEGFINIYGKRHKIPRLQAWFGDHDYSYSGETLSSKPMVGILATLCERCEQIAETRFNSVLVNYYRDGQDYMGWHADDEDELGTQPVIASLTFGACRDFDLKHKQTGERLRLALSDGSLLVMAGATQHFWQHSLPKRLRLQQPRFNLTFRYIHSMDAD
ncbi:alpha-ketoglutarate-dependent dioxygenase AlkB family protein [Echinimonas agarilytica]|uniref:Alpha-ketoglutarate-dependent dioxygenase AlkB n=1 Tax=Echinimonas agarilytica TaxID=1215918 RepID=A0AA42B866_9GAMM|nr:alpha-ketoglutarate-dependent dioxygenase AlkB [Echinimonas agarilytica]MCM2680559.1 alpha-ketoglutarate-dependent dioxygenase AlkB [Echinimonas agarilytica]